METNEFDKVFTWELSNRGFGSELNNLLYAINYSNKNNLKIRLLSNRWNFKINKGWSDYFSTMNVFEEKKGENIFFIYDILRRIFGLSTLCYFSENRKGLFTLNNNVPQSRFYKVFSFSIMHLFFRVLKPKNIEFVIDYFYKVRNFNEKELFDNEDGFIKEMNVILHDIWQFNDETKTKVLEKKNNFYLTDYAVFHIRRGDKVTTGEDDFYDVSDYMERLRELKKSIDTIFIMSDDYTVFESIVKEFPKYNYYTLIDPKQRGHLQSEFNKQSVQEIEDSAINLFTEIEIAKNSNLFIGSKNSNVFRLIEYFKIKNCYDISKVRSKYYL